MFLFIEDQYVNKSKENIDIDDRNANKSKENTNIDDRNAHKRKMDTEQFFCGNINNKSLDKIGEK